MILTICVLRLVMLGQWGLLFAKTDKNLRKEEIKALSRTITIMKIMNINSKLLFEAKLSMHRMSPKVRSMVRTLRYKNIMLNDGIVSLQGRLDYLRSFPDRDSSLETLFCRKDAAGNLQLSNVPIIFQYSDSAIFNGNLLVTVNKRGHIGDLKVVSENFDMLDKLFDGCQIPDNSCQRQLLSDWVGKLQTFLFLHDTESIKKYLNCALWVSVNNSTMVYGMENCDMLLTENVFFPYDVNMSKHPSGKYYIMTVKLHSISLGCIQKKCVHVIWDFRLPDNPCPLVFVCSDSELESFNEIRLR